LKIEARAQLAVGLIDRVGHLVQIGLRDNIE